MTTAFEHHMLRGSADDLIRRGFGDDKEFTAYAIRDMCKLVDRLIDQNERLVMVLRRAKSAAAARSDAESAWIADRNAVIDEVNLAGGMAAFLDHPLRTAAEGRIADARGLDAEFTPRAMSELWVLADQFVGQRDRLVAVIERAKFLSTPQSDAESAWIAQRNAILAEVRADV